MDKIPKIDKEIAKTKAQIAGAQKKLKELEQQKTQEENLQIVQAVRAIKMTPDELRRFLQKQKAPKIKDDQPGNPAHEESEENHI